MMVLAVVVENGVSKDALASTTMKVIKLKLVIFKCKFFVDDLEIKVIKKKCDVNDVVKKFVLKK